MIGFGELRKRSMEWHLDLAEVERVYACDWLLKGLFSQVELASLVLRGGSALRYAYSADYPVPEMPEFLVTESLSEAVLAHSLEQAATTAAQVSRLEFVVDLVARGSARVKFTGPLGRRSAAQPHINLSFVSGKLRLAPMRVPLLHPFSDECVAQLAVTAAEELIGERIAMLTVSPRARDVFDLWFASTQLPQPIDWAQALALARELSAARNIPMPSPGAVFSSAHRTRLAQIWATSLRNIQQHPTFDQVEADLATILSPH